jgi:hypothetical protein
MPSANPTIDERGSSQPVTPQSREVRFFIPQDFPADANELFAIADRDIPVSEEGTLDSRTTTDDLPQYAPPVPTDQLVIEVNQYNDGLDSREDRRVH